MPNRRLTYNGKELKDAEFEAPPLAFLDPPPPVKRKGKDGFVQLLALYGGLIAPDAITTEANIRRGDRDLNPLVREAPGTAGRMAYFGGEAAGFALLDKLLGRLDPRLRTLLRAYVAGQREGLIGANSKIFDKYNVPPEPRR